MTEDEAFDKLAAYCRKDVELSDYEVKLIVASLEASGMTVEKLSGRFGDLVIIDDVPDELPVDISRVLREDYSEAPMCFSNYFVTKKHWVSRNQHPRSMRR